MKSGRWALVGVCVCAGVAAALACGGRLAIPERRVIEGDIDGWRYRRYQKVVDVEVEVAGNSGRGHIASYAREHALAAGRLAEGDVVSAFVTEYQKRDGVRPALVGFARRLAQDSGYRVEERHVGGQRVIEVSRPGESWAFWTSGAYLIKVGGPGVAAAPPAVVEAYGRHYPSELPREALEHEPGEAIRLRGNR